jgi:hypothetical protein
LPRLTFGSVASIVAAVLATAALAKLYQIFTEVIDPKAMTGTEYRMVFWSAGELALALLLLSGRELKAVRFLTLGVLGAFAIYNAYQGLTGEATCGCFGRLPVSPWLTLTLDVLLLAAVVWSRVDGGEGAAAPVLGWPAFAGAGCICLAALGLGHFAYGSVTELLAVASFEELSLSPPALRVGAGHGGSFCKVPVTLTNHSPREIEVVGAQQDCFFFVADSLPFTLAPGERRQLTAYARYVPIREREFYRSIVLYTTCRSQPVLRLEVRGVVEKE